MSGTDDSDGTDDDGWGEAADQLAPNKTDEPPASPAPEPAASEDLDVDDMWGMAPPPPVGQEPAAADTAPAQPAAKTPATPRARTPTPVGPPKPYRTVGKVDPPPKEAASPAAAKVPAAKPAAAPAAKPAAAPAAKPAAAPAAKPAAAPAAKPDPLPASARPAEPLEPMPDYSAEANRWREELTSAVDGTKPKPASAATERTTRKHMAPPEPKRRLSARNTRIAIGGGIGVVLIGVIIALGWFNSRDYYLVCATEQISAERGRKFPPWGTSAMSGAEWKPIKIPRNTECIEHQTSDVAELETHFLEALLAQANAMLASAEPANIELAEKQLEQAFLLTRAPERRDKRKEVERLVGDVEYWRAAAQVRAAVTELGKAGEQFEGAAKRLPRHQTDSSAWAEYTRHVSEELLRGPPSLRPTQPTTLEPGDTPPFKGTGPDSPVRMPDAGVPEVQVDAQPGVMLPPITDAAPAPPDAGLPRGGVLL